MTRRFADAPTPLVIPTMNFDADADEADKVDRDAPLRIPTMNFDDADRNRSALGKDKLTINHGSGYFDYEQEDEDEDEQDLVAPSPLIVNRSW